VNGVTIALEEETAALGAKARGVLELGIRPMHIEVHDSAVDDGVPARSKRWKTRAASKF
jgi:hypothetical protein